MYTKKIIQTSLLLFFLIAFMATGCKLHQVQKNAADSAPPLTGEELPEQVISVITPAFFNEVGDTLNMLKSKYPAAEILIRPDGFPDAAAACLGEPKAPYVYFFFGGQSGDFEAAMEKCGEQLKCAGFLTSASVLFPEMEDDMSFADFFSLINVSDYTYFAEEDATTAKGWLNFKYHDMDVWLNTNETTTGGLRFTGDEIIRRSAPVTITDEELFRQNQELADTVIFK